MTNGGERLVYKIAVTGPGMRSQGWRGTLFDKNGTAMQVEPGKTVLTNVGQFVCVGETTLQMPCGMIHTDMARWMTTGSGNVIMDNEPWEYRLYVAHEGSKSEGWRGELRHSRGIIAGPNGGEPAKTPMGPYAWIENEHMWGLHGWIHVSWSGAKAQAQPDAALLR